MAILKVQPWGEGQGDFVIIDEENFDPKFHKLYEEKGAEKPKKPIKKEIK